MLSDLAEHGDLDIACAVAGVDPAELQDAMDADPKLARDVRKAVYARQSTAMAVVHKAIAQGDAATAKWLLERTNRKFAAQKPREEQDEAKRMAKLSDAQLLELAGIKPSMVAFDHGREDKQETPQSAPRDAEPRAYGPRNIYDSGDDAES